MLCTYVACHHVCVCGSLSVASICQSLVVLAMFIIDLPSEPRHATFTSKTVAKTNCCQVTGSQVYRGVKGCVLVCMAREPEGNQSPKCKSLLPGPQHNSFGSEVWQQCSSLSLSLCAVAAFHLHLHFR